MGENELEVRHSKWNMASYGSGSAARQLIDMAFTGTLFFYYKAVVGLQVEIIFLATFLFALYNMVNDPLF